jgi:hypothetical protein
MSNNKTHFSNDVTILNEINTVKPRGAQKLQRQKSVIANDDITRQKSKETLSEFNNEKLQQKQPILVKGKIIFTRIGEINTKAERFDSEIYYECSWEDDKLFEIFYNSQNFSNLKRNDFQSKLEFMNKSINQFTYNPSIHWSPKVYIDNAIGEPKGETNYTLEIIKKENANNLAKYENLDYTIRVTEMKTLKGIFYEV